ncbi:MAG: DUF945 domain-containing protein [Polaromonas sp.]|nr:DUF945 domain-containing protein [Gemmatimonadaceae bacterium]
MHAFVVDRNPVSFSRARTEARSDRDPLTEDQLRRVAPSIFAEEAHDSRSKRYTYIPTISVLRGLQGEGFEPFMVAQTRVRDDSRREHTKHMLRLRHRSQSVALDTNEIILINSHDGSSAYQMLAGTYRLVCRNGMVCFRADEDIKISHKGNVGERVVSSAYEVLDGFTRVVEEREGMKALTLNAGEQSAFARAALELRFDTDNGKATPVTEAQVLAVRRSEDRADDLWTVTNRVQEALVRGGIDGRLANGRRAATRAVQGIDQNVKLNRALWVLATEMRRMKE